METPYQVLKKGGEKKKQVRQGFLTNNLFAALEKLFKLARKGGTWTDKMYKKYKAIYKKATKIMLAAEE